MEPTAAQVAGDQTHYEFLGVDAGASADQIKAAYRRVAMQFHPDLNDQPGCEQIFARAYAAYRCLCDPDERVAYDQYLEKLARGEIPEPEPVHPRRRPRRGVDRQVILRVPRRIRVQRVVLSFDRWDLCPRCTGTGESDGRACIACLGVGQVLARREVALHIRSRKLIGGALVLPEEGDVGMYGGPRGDAIVRVLTHQDTIMGSFWPAFVAAMVFYALIGLMLLGWLLSA